jgi:uncharacterized protein (DUF1778 family)
VFRVRVLATQEEIALIAKAARKQGLSASQFVTRVARNLGRKLKDSNIKRRDATSRKQTKPLRRKPRSSQ